MRKKARHIKYKKERMILSDVLPFELPLTFSNRYFYDFLIKNKVEIKDGKLKWIRNEACLNEIIKLLFDFRTRTITTNEIDLTRGNAQLLKTIPFNYKISHKESDFRELTIVHPKNQLLLVDFYNTYQHLIPYYCNVSPFSIRRAEKTAKFTYYKDKTHYDRLSKNELQEVVEEYDKEYESLKTFFVYKNYSNIHKFYESYKYHRCEQKYDKLFKFDISKCFDSIYTHSITWALLNKNIVKDNIQFSNQTFGGKFDSLMQNLNYGETNGIVIGPEFSRIFAELILQKVDNNVETLLRLNHKLTHKVDYQIFRYVDDFFVFYNEEHTKEIILQNYRLQLKEYKLAVNDAKSVHYDKPIITEITIAKRKITQLLNKYLSYKIEEVLLVNIDEDDEEEFTEKRGLIYINSNKLITQFKAIIKESDVEYKDILNFTLAVIERRVSKIIKDYKKLKKETRSEKLFTRAILEALDFIFFIYSVSPRVNTTIRLCRILRILTEYFNGQDKINFDFKHLVFKKIYDNVYFILQKNKSIANIQVETLYLLIVLGELGKEYWLDEHVLCKYFNIERKEDGELSIKASLNYLTCVVLLFYIKEKKRYRDIRFLMKEHIKAKFVSMGQEKMGMTTELVLLLFDVLTCPYLEEEYKKELLTLNMVSDPVLQNEIIYNRKYWFTKWTDFDFGKELDAKHSLEVY